MSKKTTRTEERYDAAGHLVEKIVTTLVTEDDTPITITYPGYSPYSYYPWYPSVTPTTTYNSTDGTSFIDNLVKTIERELPSKIRSEAYRK